MILENKRPSLSHEEVFAAAAQLVDKYVSMWVEVCNIESQTIDKEGVDRVGAFFIEHAKGLGYEIDVHYEEKAGNALTLTMNPDAKGAPVCISGHMDTVFPRGLFGYPPTRIEGDMIYGPGVVDCKGGLIVGSLAMEALLRCGYNERPIKMIFQSDEEVDSRLSEKRTVAYMAKMAEGCTAFINLESTTPGYHIIERKGIRRYEIDIYGKAAHSSTPEKGANAIVEAACKIKALASWQPPEGVTVNVGVVEGGTAINAVAEHCQFLLDIRYTADEQIPVIEDFLQRIVDNNEVEGTKSTLKLHGYRVAMPRAKRNEELLERLNATYARAGLSSVVASKGTGGSDASDMTSYGIPVVDNAGATGARNHSLDEFARISSLLENAKRVIAAILYL